MITKVKCGTKDCDWENRPISTVWLNINYRVPLEGPFVCPKCDQPMKVDDRVLASYKGRAGAKTTPCAATTKPSVSRSSKPGGKRKPAGLKVTGVGAMLDYKLGKRKASTGKSGKRKRGPSK